MYNVAEDMISSFFVFAFLFALGFGSVLVYMM